MYRTIANCDEGALAFRSFLDISGKKIAGAVEKRLRQVLPPGRKMPDVEFLLELIGLVVEDDHEKLRDTSHELRDAQLDSKAATSDRDETASEARDVLGGVGDQVEFGYGLGGFFGAGFPRRVPEKPEVLHEVGVGVCAKFRRGVDLGEPRHAWAKVDSAATADRIEPVFDRLGERIERTACSRIRTGTAKYLRDKHLDTFHRDYHRFGEILTALCFVGGEDALARLAPPSLRKLYRHGKRRRGKKNALPAAAVELSATQETESAVPGEDSALQETESAAPQGDATLQDAAPAAPQGDATLQDAAPAAPDDLSATRSGPPVSPDEDFAVQETAPAAGLGFPPPPSGPPAAPEPSPAPTDRKRRAKRRGLSVTPALAGLFGRHRAVTGSFREPSRRDLSVTEASPDGENGRPAPTDGRQGREERPPAATGGVKGRIRRFFGGIT